MSLKDCVKTHQEGQSLKLIVAGFWQRTSQELLLLCYSGLWDLVDDRVFEIELNFLDFQQILILEPERADGCRTISDAWVPCSWRVCMDSESWFDDKSNEGGKGRICPAETEEAEGGFMILFVGVIWLLWYDST